MCYYYSFSQELTATLLVDKVNITGKKAGEEVIVPVRLMEKSKGKVLGFQFFIDFNHDVLYWPGHIDEPLKGVRNINDEMPFEEDGWVFNDNGNQIVALWNDPGLMGKDLPGGIVLFEIVFILQNNVNDGLNMTLSWGETYEIVDDKLAKGPTEMYDEDGEKYTLKYVNGEIRN
jgi:hypothetical protein